MDGPPRRNPNQDGEGAPGPADDGEEVELYEASGMLEMHPNGYGFLRSPQGNYSRERTDPFVPGTMIEKFGLREGVYIKGSIQPARRQTGPRVREILDVDGMAPDEYSNVPAFETKTPVNPDRWFQLEIGSQPLTNRVIDLLAPLGKGQRGLIVAPPRSGKTVMLQHISEGIAKNHPDTKLMVLLIDERPEEVTDMKRHVEGEVIASSLDETIDNHVRLSQLVIERCKRLAEMGQDVFLLLDSITRLARAYNKWVGNSGKIMSGGVDIKAMDIPKKLFATARAFEEGGSLTIVGTALIDTGSRMDDLIFQEFKGTGNMELVLDRRLADRRVWPAIDISQSGTRREELLLSPESLHAITMLRRTLTSMHPVEAMEQLTKQLGRFPTNSEFIKLIAGKMSQD
ncbi:MAG: transcription termination factor Rho [Pirellulaceae bacterium]